MEIFEIDYLVVGGGAAGMATAALEEKKLIDIYNNGMECGVTDLVIDHDDINDYEFLNFRTSVFSPSTGVFDSHHFIQSLKSEFDDNDGLLLVGNELKSIDYVKDSFEVLINDLNNKTEFVIRTKRIVNSAGLNTYKIINELKGTDQYIPKYMKGEYYSYGGKQKLNHLIYPIPGEYSLGIHATIDLGHGIRFGPSSYEVTDLDYQVSFDHRGSFFESIKGYWPDINIEELYTWKEAFAANRLENIDAVYDEFSIWFLSKEDTPEEKLTDLELREALLKALKKLEKVEALVIQLYYVEELNVFEIAKILELTNGRISQIKSAAIKTLRTQLKFIL